MPFLSSCSLILSLLFQTAYIPSFPAGMFTEKEQKKLDKNTDDLEERIEVYRDASERISKSIGKNIAQKKLNLIPGQLETWVALLTESVKDIEASINPEKKKSKDLIKYEIQVRKTINDLSDYKIRAPVDQQDPFEKYIEQADILRNEMVKLLFEPEKAEEENK